MSDTDHAAEIIEALEEGFQPTEDWEYLTPSNREKVIHHADALQRERDELHRKIELLEWTAYQCRQHPEWSEADILGRVAYVPEWRELEGEVTT